MRAVLMVRSILASPPDVPQLYWVKSSGTLGSVHDAVRGPSSGVISRGRLGGSTGHVV